MTHVLLLCFLLAVVLVSAHWVPQKAHGGHMEGARMADALLSSDLAPLFTNTYTHVKSGLKQRALQADTKQSLLRKEIGDARDHVIRYHESAHKGKNITLDDTNTSHVSRSGLATWQQALREDPHLFDGCSRIFLDVGSNRGTHIRKLFEPQKYPNCTYLRFFDQGFGSPADRTRQSSATGICAFGFEANPRWTATLQNIEQAYAAMGWRTKWFAPEAVSNHSGSPQPFWINDKGKYSDWGFSERKTSDDATKVMVPTLDLSGFMEQLNKLASPGYRLMKMDIESAEFEVLPPFLDKQLLCETALNVLTIEWHDRFLNSDASKQKARELEQRVLSSSKCTSGPSTDVQNIDDESYRDDGKPLPPQ